ncbi:MAG: hypothetical protein M3317_12435 [Actinomycetota bacterium]|nr:hypothetical protein [Actinomycetota bacterium]
MTAGLLALTVFVATAVEMVEALTIVLAVGVSRGWRSTLQGALAALVALIVLVAIFGTSLATEVPLHLLQFAVGLGLLILGLSWLRKAVARASGLRPHRDEAAAFERLVERVVSDRRAGHRRDAVAWIAAFKGVFLEGLEAAIIATTFGAAARQMPVAFLSAGAAVALVAIVGVIVHRPLSRIPENALKLGVGLLLSSFGTFWIVEGLGGEWPGSELAVLYIAAAYAAAAFLIVRLVIHSTAAMNAGPGSDDDRKTAVAHRSFSMRRDGNQER